MADSQAEGGSDFVEGVTIAPEDLQARFGIEPYEIASYRDITWWVHQEPEKAL